MCKPILIHRKSCDKCHRFLEGFFGQNGSSVLFVPPYCRTSSIQRHFQTKHEKHVNDEADKAETIKRAVAKYGKQSGIFTNVCDSKDEAT